MGFVQPNDGFSAGPPPSNFDPNAGQFMGYNPPPAAAHTPTGGLPNVPTGLPNVPTGLPNVPSGLPSVPSGFPQTPAFTPHPAQPAPGTFIYIL